MGLWSVCVLLTGGFGQCVCVVDRWLWSVCVCCRQVALVGVCVL